MKKRILITIIFLGVFFTFVFGVKALERAKAPTEIPAVGTKMYASTDTLDAVNDAFNYSAISFKSGSNTVAGSAYMEKIKLSTNYNITETTPPSIELSDNWFTAYCLDPSLYYPRNGLSATYNIGSVLSNAGSGDIDKSVLDQAVLAGLLNRGINRNIYNLFKRLLGGTELTVSYELPEGYNASDANVYKTILTNILDGQELSFKINSISSVVNSETVTITGEEIRSVEILEGGGSPDPTATDPYYITLSNADIHFDIYKAANMENNAANNHMLWIIEHSYPTIDLDRLYADAGVIASNLRTEVLGLPGNTELSDDDKIENYVYSTIQYAIWHVLGIEIHGKTIGDTLVSTDSANASKVVELNKLYQYLIVDRSEYATYGDSSKTFGNTLTIVAPSGKAIKEESDSTIKYGPYKVTSDMVTAGNISLSVKDNVKGVKIVNAANNEITSIKENEDFYILVDKKTKIASDRVYIVAKTTEGKTFEPSSNRGRVYYSSNPLTQNVASGGKIKSVEAENSIKIDVNVHTGILNIASLFIMTLIVFSIGYLLLNYKNKQVEL